MRRVEIKLRDRENNITKHAGYFHCFSTTWEECYVNGLYNPEARIGHIPVAIVELDNGEIMWSELHNVKFDDEAVRCRNKNCKS